MRVCLYGGAFDPPHRVHRTIIEAGRAQLDFDRVVVMPSGQHPFKQDGAHAPGSVRAELCRLAFADLPWVSVDEREVRRHQTSYTVDTLRAFRQALPPDDDLYFLIGSDNVPTLPLWREHHAALALAQFVVVPRAGHPMPPADFDELDLTPQERAGLRAHVLTVEPSAVSSTEVRRRLRHGEDVSALLSVPVHEAIVGRHLYGT
ncbi:MAG: nicotinate (nicotinamide) nucleotide adenylyltransferase [Planctomycetota bacterium]